ncbi:MAG: hypothetical protein HKN32_02935, partial [Flavobacteriales bacterium]|nr:hypothetical protein [Flavobacteriales bacterium]
MKTLPRLLLISTCGLWMSCNLINPAEGVPAFVAVDEYTFETTSVQGTSSEKFTEIWAFDQGTMMGAFELPASIPVLAEGSRDMSFFAGIKNNGISST